MTGYHARYTQSVPTCDVEFYFTKQYFNDYQKFVGNAWNQFFFEDLPKKKLIIGLGFYMFCRVTVLPLIY